MFQGCFESIGLPRYDVVYEPTGWLPCDGHQTSAQDGLQSCSGTCLDIPCRTHLTYLLILNLSSRSVCCNTLQESPGTSLFLHLSFHCSSSRLLLPSGVHLRATQGRDVVGIQSTYLIHFPLRIFPFWVNIL